MLLSPLAGNAVLDVVSGSLLRVLSDRLPDHTVDIVSLEVLRVTHEHNEYHSNLRARLGYTAPRRRVVYRLDLVS